MKCTILVALVLLPALLLLGGCTGGTDSKGTPGKGSEHKAHEGKQYEIKGKVTGVDAAKSSVKLDHEEIVGLMKAMEMEYSVENPKMLEGLKVGDQVHGHMKVESGKYTILHLEKH